MKNETWWEDFDGWGEGKNNDENDGCANKIYKI